MPFSPPQIQLTVPSALLSLANELVERELTIAYSSSLSTCRWFTSASTCFASSTSSTYSPVRVSCSTKPFDSGRHTAAAAASSSFGAASHWMSCALASGP